MVRLVIFDVEGVLLPRKRTLIIEIAKYLNWTETLKLLFFGYLYQIRIISLSSFIKVSYKLFRGTSIDTFFDIYQITPILKNSQEVFRRLKEHGVTTVLMSSGLPQEILEDLKDRLNADKAYGVHVDKDEFGVLSGVIWGDVIDDDGKRRILKSIVKEMVIDIDEVVVVADDSNNLQMIQDCGLFIGFNPENMVAARTEVVVNGDDLYEVFQVIQGQPLVGNVFRKELLLRKVLHSSGAFTLLFLKFFGLSNTKLMIITLMVLFSLSEYLRLSGSRLPLFTGLTRFAALGLEKTSVVTTPIWYALGVLLTITLFPFKFAVIGVLTLTLGDTVASLVGQSLYIKHSYPFNKSKSIEGTLAGFIVALIACSFFFDPYISFFGCLIGMIVEALPLPLNDNMIIPVFSSLISYAFNTCYFV